MDFVDDGGQGGAFMVPWKMGKMNFICLSSHLELILVVCVVLESHLFMLHGEIVSSCTGMHALNNISQHCFGCFLLMRLNILHMDLHVWF